MNNTPKINTERNKYGLLEIDYKFNEHGFIDWRGMVSPEFLYVNPDQKRRAKIESKYKKKYEEIDPISDNVEDVDLIIMLGGLKQILKMKGFTSVNYVIKESTESYASVTCSITFLPSYESNYQPLVYSENACATLNNTNSFAKNYLLEIASNRALARCIRSCCNINIVSREELGGNQQEDEKLLQSNSLQPHTILSNLLKDKNISFKELIKDESDKDKWKDINDIPKMAVFKLIGKIKTQLKV